MILELKNTNLVAIIDDNPNDYITKKPWGIQRNGYVTRTIYLGKINGKYTNKTEYLHRLVFNPDLGFQVDHIDGNKLNNKLNNLRMCTNQENNRNTKSRKGSTSQYKGVSWDSSNKKWLSQICIGNNKHIRIGRFLCEIDAAKAYDNEARKHFGEFCYLNFK